MRKEIVTRDVWFKNAKEMHTFLDEHFKDDPSKEYVIIDEEETAELRKKGREERKVNGCKGSHVMSFFPDGTSIKIWKTLKDFMQGTEADSYDTVDGGDTVEGDEDVDDTEEVVWCESIETTDMYNLIDVGSFVAIRATSKSVELFHLMKVIEKGIAENNISDSSMEHCVLKGEPYLLAKWYSFHKDGKKFAQFIESKGSENALIHVGEVFSTNIEVDEKNQMNIADYWMLACSI